MSPSVEEVLRCLGAGEDAPEELRYEAETVSAELETSIQPRWVWKLIPLGEACPLSLTGELAGTMLAECDSAAVLCCTLGAQFDALLRTLQAKNMSRAVMADAWGSACVESGCDAAEREIAARFPNRYLTDRFSPGYGDLPLGLQQEICTLLDTERRLGVHATEHCLLNPQKSVTAIVGLSDKPQMARIRGCAYCSMGETCLLRKGGKRCAL